MHSYVTVYYVIKGKSFYIDLSFSTPLRVVGNHLQLGPSIKILLNFYIQQVQRENIDKTHRVFELKRTIFQERNEESKVSVKNPIEMIVN